MRLDLFLAEIGIAKSRTHANNLIKLGKIIVDGKIAKKASQEVNFDVKIDVDKSDDYASLGGIKLQKAVDYWNIDIKDKTCIDIGASNGGFTDVMLRAGAKKVYCVDIAECMLPDYMLEDERVVVKDKLNARYLTFEDIGIKTDILTIDVSFISLTQVLPALVQFFDKGSELVALIKPQFEVGRANLTKSGIVSNKKAVINAINDIKAFVKVLGFNNIEVIEAPHPFENKNQEYLLHCIFN